MKILDRETEPNNMARWEEAPWIEYKWAHKKAVMLRLQKYEWNPPPLRQNGKGRSWHPDKDPRPYVPMDVDEPSFTFVSHAYTEEDKAHYQKEGQCFYCDKQGHMARECPSHKQQPGKPQKPTFRKKSYPTSYKKPT